jgi:fructose-bisphosphate aldolase class I
VRIPSNRSICTYVNSKIVAKLPQLRPEHDGVSLMKPIPGLDALLTRAVALGIIGTKMRSVINLPSKDGVAAVVAQQFEVAAQIAEHGLMPIVEPEVSIKSPDKAGAEAILLTELTRKLEAASDGFPVMLKLTIPDVPDFYSALTSHKRVARVVALSVRFGEKPDANSIKE